MARTDLVPISNSSLMELLGNELVRRAGFPTPVLHSVISERLARDLTAAPLLEYDKARTEEAVQAMANAVEPVVISFKHGQPVVSPTSGVEGGREQLRGPSVGSPRYRRRRDIRGVVVRMGAERHVGL